MLIFLFKAASSVVIDFSGKLYAFVRADINWLPLFLVGATVVGLCSALILQKAKDCRGGGIPTAVASVRALIPMRWVEGIFGVFFAAMLTYLGGVPLGNEGPSVQMGTAVGKGTAYLIGKKGRAYERYTMTGGACAGFATATGAPLTGIIFALEEVHRRFSPTIFLAAATSVLTGSVTQDLLARIFSVDVSMFSFDFSGKLAIKELPLAALVGILCACAALAFTLLYQRIRRIVNRLLKRISFVPLVALIFAVCALLGFFSSDLIGSGHALIHRILSNETVWYILIFVFILRAISVITGNTAGITGGVFLPILTFGAILGAILGEVALTFGLVSAEGYPVLIAASMATFLAVASRTPITAVAFSAEVLCGVENVLPVAISVAVGYMVAEISGITSFNDVIIESKVEAEHEGKMPLIVDTHMTVCNGCFAEGQEIRDILWPPTCTVLSVVHFDKTAGSALAVGDILHIHYASYEPEETLDVLYGILGEQEEMRTKTHIGGENHTVPD